MFCLFPTIGWTCFIGIWFLAQYFENGQNIGQHPIALTCAVEGDDLVKYERNMMVLMILSFTSLGFCICTTAVGRFSPDEEQGGTGASIFALCLCLLRFGLTV